MSEIYGLDHVQLAMPPGAEERARGFYIGVLGLAEQPKPANLARRGGVWFIGGRLRLHLGVEGEFRPATKAHPALLVRGIESLAARCNASGFPVTTDEPLDGCLRVYVSDPFGNRIELMEWIEETKMRAVFKTAVPYAGDALNLPVGNLEKALPFYETVMGFRLVSRKETPIKSALLCRDSIQMGLVENGGDPSQEGCFFEVDDAQTAFTELQSNGLTNKTADFKVQKHGETSYKVFFVIAPDGLCYCLGERQG